MDCKAFRMLPGVAKSFDSAAARQSIYFDYEGTPHAPPTLLGWRLGDTYSAAIVEPAFADCAARLHAKAPTAMDHATAARLLIERAVDERRHLVSWSLHDPRLLCAVLSPQLQVAFRQRYVDAVKLARPWHYRTFNCVPPNRARQAYFACLFEIWIPASYRDRVVGSPLRELRAQFDVCQRYGDLTQQQRKMWVAVVKHNLWDLRVMESIVQRILSGRPAAWDRSPDTCAGGA